MHASVRRGFVWPLEARDEGRIGWGPRTRHEGGRRGYTGATWMATHPCPDKESGQAPPVEGNTAGRIDWGQRTLQRRGERPAVSARGYRGGIRMRWGHRTLHQQTESASDSRRYTGGENGPRSAPAATGAGSGCGGDTARYTGKRRAYRKTILFGGQGGRRGVEYRQFFDKGLEKKKRSGRLGETSLPTADNAVDGGFSIKVRFGKPNPS